MKAAELWRQRPAVIFAVRRPSCPFCQLTALQLSALKVRFDKHEIGCYAISHQVDGLNAFVDRFRTFTDSIGMPSLLIDQQSAIFAALGSRTVPATGGGSEAE